jgi:hypothetical protein
MEVEGKWCSYIEDVFMLLAGVTKKNKEKLQ